VQLDADDRRIIQPGDPADGLAGAVTGRSVLDRMIYIDGARHMAPSILNGKTDAEVLSWIAKQVDLGRPGGPKGSPYEPWDKLVHEARHRARSCCCTKPERQAHQRQDRRQLRQRPKARRRNQSWGS
jgi:hypothetical protein